MKTLFFSVLTILSLLSLFGCETDVKPSYFYDMFRDGNDIDRLSDCLIEIPVIKGDMLTIKTDIPCLSDLSNRDKSDLYSDSSFSDILDYPVSYLNQIVSFEATAKDVYLGLIDRVELYTNRKYISFEIQTGFDVDLYILDDDGEEQDLENGLKYRFTCRITQIEINETGDWSVDADFILSNDDEEIAILPELVE